MSGILSRWVVLQEHTVAPSDVDDAGAFRAEVVAGWLDAARAAYLERCPLLGDLGKDADWDVRTVGPAPIEPSDGAGVAVSATAAEIQPTIITLSLRVRIFDRAVNARSTIRLLKNGEVVELGKGVRDELIALEHAAEEYN
jgi:hypothetical protein